MLCLCACAGGQDSDRAGSHDSGPLLLQPGSAAWDGRTEAGGHRTGAAPQAQLRELQQPAGESAAPGQDQVSQSIHSVVCQWAVVLLSVALHPQKMALVTAHLNAGVCLLYTSPSPRDGV